MEAWTHYFTFKRTSEHYGYWVEITAKSNRKAVAKMNELHRGQWEKHYSGYAHFLPCDKGCLDRYEVD